MKVPKSFIPNKNLDTKVEELKKDSGLQKHLTKNRYDIRNLFQTLKEKHFLIETENYIAYIFNYQGRAEQPHEFSNYISILAEQVLVQKKGRINFSELQTWLLNGEEKPTIVMGERKNLQKYFFKTAKQYKKEARKKDVI